MTPSSKPSRLLVLLGPTAVGKTRLAALLAHAVKGAVISTDSRQVFRGMDIGTGKDISDYVVNGQVVPFHLVDIVDAGTEYSVFSYLNDFRDVYNRIVATGKLPVVCGGTGLYVEAVLMGYKLTEVPEDPEFRKSLEHLSNDQLVSKLEGMRTLHNSTDSIFRERIIRALEIESFRSGKNPAPVVDIADAVVFGLRFDRQTIRERITLRLESRLKNGMIEEVRGLLRNGISPERLNYYGLEYRYITAYLQDEISYDKMFGLLNTAIHQFAKRQMTWFRRMERNGVQIRWLEGENGEEYNLEIMQQEVVRLVNGV